MPSVWECSCVKKLYRNTLMTNFAQAFQNDHNISDAVEQDQFSDLKKKSHFLLCGVIYSQNAFPSPIIRINVFSHKSKTTLRDFYFKFGISMTHFFCDTSKCALKQGDGNIAIDYLYTNVMKRQKSVR